MELFLHPFDDIPLALVGFLLILSSIGVITLKKPVHASLSFLSTLLLLATLYIELSAEFIGVMQVLVYAGAILVIFMFVIILFQDAYVQISQLKPKTSLALLFAASLVFIVTALFLLARLKGIEVNGDEIRPGYGTVQYLGEALYVDFFFPFEAVVFLFLVAMIGAFYIGKKQWSE